MWDGRRYDRDRTAGAVPDRADFDLSGGFNLLRVDYSLARSGVKLVPGNMAADLEGHLEALAVTDNVLSGTIAGGFNDFNCSIHAGLQGDHGDVA